MRKADLVITDIEMPQTDGLRLIRLVDLIDDLVGLVKQTAPA